MDKVVRELCFVSSGGGQRGGWEDDRRSTGTTR